MKLVQDTLMDQLLVGHGSACKEMALLASLKLIGVFKTCFLKAFWLSAHTLAHMVWKVLRKEVGPVLSSQCKNPSHHEGPNKPRAATRMLGRASPSHTLFFRLGSASFVD